MEFPTIDKFAKEVAEKALDEITYEGKTIREWAEILVKQEPCEDCISREAVLEHICEAKECYKEECKGRTLKRCPDLQWVFDLPPVTPKRPKGKWITWKEAGNYIPSETRFECSVCHDAAQTLCNGLDLLSPYCPNCGAEMGGADETN